MISVNFEESMISGVEEGNRRELSKVLAWIYISIMIAIILIKV